MPLSPSELEAARNADLSAPPGGGFRVTKLIEWIRLFRQWPRRHQSWEYRLRRRLSRDVHKKNWDGARRTAIEMAAQAVERQDYAIINEAAWSLVRLGVYSRAFELFATYRRRVSGRVLPEWDGSSLADHVLLVDSATGDVARYMFWVPLLAAVSQQAKRCIVLTDPRMVPLYQRTFPKIDVRSNVEGNKDPEGIDFVASFERLAYYFWPTGPNQTVTLKADPKLVAEFRSRYKHLGSGPIIGITWGSLNKKKGCPAMHDWAKLISATPGIFMSVQYGDVIPALKTFDKLVPGRVISDPSVDQLVNLDRFAAQLSALDAIVSINNTSAHMASALGVPTVVVLDDQFHLITTWSLGEDRTPWYKNTRLVRRNKGAWSGVMDEAGILLRELLANVSKASEQ